MFLCHKMGPFTNIFPQDHAKERCTVCVACPFLWPRGLMHSVAAITSSNPAEGMEVRLLWLLCLMQVAALASSLSFVDRSPTSSVFRNVSGLESSKMRWPKTDLGCCAPKKCDWQIITHIGPYPAILSSPVGL
jgi:hypothetical protein